MTDDPRTVDSGQVPGPGTNPRSNEAAPPTANERERGSVEPSSPASGHALGPGPTTGPEEPEAEVERVTRERDEYLDSLQRLKAEFDNYRKRAAREQIEFASRAAERLVKELLPILDDLERALEAAAEHEEAKLEAGVRLVHRALDEALRREGLTEIETDGKFDPHVHEALLTQPAEDIETGDVLQVLQKGYRLGDKVLRPARVIVAE